MQRRLSTFLEIFTAHGFISPTVKELDLVRKAFLESNSGQEATYDSVREAVDVVLTQEDVISSVSLLDQVYSWARFSGEHNSGSLRDVAMEVPPGATFALCREVSAHDKLKKAIQDFHSRTSAFRSNVEGSQNNAAEWTKKKYVKDMNLCVRSDGPMQKIKSNMDTQARWLSSVSMMMKAWQSALARVRLPNCDPKELPEVVHKKVSSYCREPSHGSKR